MKSAEQRTPQGNNRDHLVFGYTDIVDGTRHEVMDIDESLQPPQMSVRLNGTPVVMEIEEFERRVQSTVRCPELDKIKDIITVCHPGPDPGSM